MVIDERADRPRLTGFEAFEDKVGQNIAVTINAQSRPLTLEDIAQHET